MVALETMAKNKAQKPSQDEIAKALDALKCASPSLTPDDFAAPLLDWYEGHGRDLPWRKRWPELTPAYDVFLSELMLQQTVVATVIPYFERFKSLWPTIRDLAQSSEEDLLKEWAGLGYYARARNLRKAAIAIVRDHNGCFPEDEKALLTLPGVGPYTAAALSAFAFDRPAIVLDGNVERVMARFAGLITPLPALKSELRAIYPRLAPRAQHSDFAQAIMDLGSSICIAGTPRCDICPLAKRCVMAHKPEASYLPVKPKKQPKPKRQGVIFVATKQGKAVMMRREAKGLLGGMMGFPTKGWESSKDAMRTTDLGIKDAPFAADWRPLNQEVRHIFTHFELSLRVYHTAYEGGDLPDGLSLCAPDEVGLASVFGKVWQMVAASD